MIGSTNPWRMEAALEKAFRRAGHETLLVDDRRAKRLIGRRFTQQWVKQNARRFRPDFVFLSKCLALDPETVAGITRDRPNAMWYHDPQWYADLDRPDIGHIATIGKLARTFFITGFDDKWRENGLRAKFLPAAGDADIHPVAHDNRYAADMTFIGTGYDAARAEFIVALSREIKVTVWGLGWEQWKNKLDWRGRPVEGKEFASVCSSSKIVLGINPQRAAGGTNYTSDRTWMVILAGGMYLGEYTSGMGAMLEDGVHCMWYRNLDDSLNRARSLLSDPELRNTIRIEGEKFVRANHSYDQRVRFLLEDREWVNPL
ncbi:MAG TPA: glycosyltransferase [Gemmatimonadaceae bacterium]|nr:glycosyltransferase [Gemmatimonadaceae bacterium]